jgi:hypothetical protein
MLMFVVKISLDCNAPRINKMRLEVYLIRTCVTNGGDVGKSRKNDAVSRKFSEGLSGTILPLLYITCERKVLIERICTLYTEEKILNNSILYYK